MRDQKPVSQPRPFPMGGPRGPMIGDGQKAKNTKSTIYRLWRYLKYQRNGLLGVISLVIITTAFGLLTPYLMAKAIDGYIIPMNLEGLIWIIIFMLAIHILSSFSIWLQTYVMVGVSQRTVRHIRNEIFSKLQLLSLKYFDQRTHGEIMSRITNDVENVNRVIAESVAQFISSIITLVGAGVLMLLLNIRLALVSLIVIPLMIFLTKWISARTRKGFREQQKNLGTLNGFIEETITGQRIVKAYGKEESEFVRFEKANRDLQSASTHAQTFALVLAPLSNFINNVSLVIVIATGGYMSIKGWVTVGTIIAFLSYVQQFTRPLNQIANLYNSIQSALAGAERVFEVLDEVPEIEDVPNAKSLDDMKGDVVFNNVCFSYESDVPVLKNVDFHAKSGETIALVGPTGAGKTTIVNLLTRFYDIDSGEITIDNYDIRNVQKSGLRRQLGIVLQDTYLFSESVMENIRYGRLDANNEEVYSAAKLANADHFIRHLPNGYNTPLSERGSNLSQGQRQLLAIARAALANPSILILDEATSSVDTRTELNIQEALLRLMEGRTAFVIAHRLSTIRNADQVLVINGGEIIERGNHKELLDQKGFYYNLYMAQFKKTSNM